MSKWYEMSRLQEATLRFALLWMEYLRANYLLVLEGVLIDSFPGHALHRVPCSGVNTVGSARLS